MRKQTEELIERLENRLFDTKVVLITDDELMTTLALVRYNCCEFIIECKWFEKQNWTLHNIHPIDGYISGFIVDMIETIVEERKDVE